MSIKQPRNVKIVTPHGKVELKFNSRLAAKYGRQFSKAQKFVDSEVLRRSDKFLPFRTGTLRNTGILGTHIGSGTVQWTAPYARYLYYGKVMAGKPRKPTAKNLKFVGGPTRGAFWFRRMWEVNRTRIVEGARKIMQSEKDKS